MPTPEKKGGKWKAVIYEYYILDLSMELEEWRMEAINKIASKGWELYMPIADEKAYFRRPLNHNQ